MRLLAPDHTPIPPQEIERRIKNIDPSLFLKWQPPYPDLGKKAAWGVCQKWEAGDPRRRMIYNGEMSPTDDYDLVATLPEDCTVDEAPAWIAKSLRRYHDKEDMQRLLNRVTAYNSARQNDAFEDVHSEALNMIELRGGQMFENSTGMKSIKVVGRSHTPRSKGKKASEL